MPNSNETSGGQLTSLLKKVWGALPVVALVLIILILGKAIDSRTDKLEAVKAGLSELKAKRLAMDRMADVMAIVSQAKDDGEAVEKIAAALNLTADQARAIVHQPMGALVKAGREKLDRQIAFIEQQIAENKLDVQSPPPDVNVVALTLVPRPIRDRINLPGIVEPWVKFNIVAEVRGEVVEKRLEKGTSVSAGDIIARLDTEDYEIALQAAKASYNTALASKKRLEKLYKEQLASRSQLDDITAQVEQFKAQMDSAALNLKRCTIRSPISGVINNVYIDQGQYVNVSDPVAEVLQMDKVKVIVGIPESDVRSVDTVEEFDVSFDALGGRMFTARKYFLSRASDPMARLYNLELQIENPEGEILPDMFARVDIVKQKKPDALAVPLYAIITLNNEQTVYVMDESDANAVSRKVVKTGIQEGWRMEITEGLDAGAQVVVVGHRSLSDGQTVNVVKTVSRMEDLAN